MMARHHVDRQDLAVLLARHAHSDVPAVRLPSREVTHREFACCVERHAVRLRRTLPAGAGRIVLHIADPVELMAATLAVLFHRCEALLATPETPGALVAVLSVIRITAGHFASMLFSVLGEKAAIRLDARLTRAVQGQIRLPRQEVGEFADRLALLREEIGTLSFAVQGLIQSLAVVVQVVLTVALLGRLHPILALLPLAALAPYLAGRWANSLRERARTQQAENRRRAHALLGLAHQPGPMLEIRLSGLSGELQRRQRDLLVRASRGLLRSEAIGAVTLTAGQAIFAAAYALALVLVVQQVAAGHSGTGDVVLAIMLAQQVATGISQMLGLAGALQKASRTGARFRKVLSDAQDDEKCERDGLAAPARLRQGIRLEDVSFGYPESGADALRAVNLELPAGTVVGIVGENGAGKSTLVKLLSGLYQPTAGRITVDGIDLSTVRPADWRQGVSAVFQDFSRFEFIARRSAGIGDLPHVDDERAVRRAFGEANAETLLAKLPQGLDTRVGSSFLDGIGLSGGEWQKMALARAMMRRRPVVRVLDEPSAALDAVSEYQLFERHLTMARQAALLDGAITLLVSHRFSTVRAADLIVVMRDGSVAEQGTHEDLMAAGGDYAELFELQARGYREEHGKREGTP